MDSSKADEILRRIEKLSERRYLPIIGLGRGQILVDQIRNFKPKRILEVGTFIGYSTILMGKELGSGSEIVTIEIDEGEAELARENIHEAGIKPKVRVLTGNALKIIPGLEGEFDLMFLDAAKSQYLTYLRLAEDKLHGGSVVIADNAGYFSYSMRDYLDYVRNSGKYESRFISSDFDGIEVSIKL